MKINSLSELLKDYGEEAVKHFLSCFSVSKDADIQKFITELAIPYEKAFNAKTYIVENNKGVPVGFFSIAISTLLVPKTLTNNQKKNIRGFGRYNSDYVPCYLIGQLARFDNASKEDIKLNEFLNMAQNRIEKAKSYCGGRIITLDCKDVLLEKYKEHGFMFIGKTEDLNHLIKYIHSEN